jgi:hypothetical protein
VQWGGDELLGTIQAREEHAPLPIERIGNNLASVELECERSFHQDG